MTMGIWNELAALGGTWVGQNFLFQYVYDVMGRIALHPNIPRLGISCWNLMYVDRFSQFSNFPEKTHLLWIRCPDSMGWIKVGNWIWNFHSYGDKYSRVRVS